MSTATFITASEAASVIGITPGRVRQLLRDNHIEGGRKLGGVLWAIPIVSVKKYAKKNRSLVGRPRISDYTY